MADTKISGATNNAAPAGTDKFATAQGGTSRATSLDQVKTYVTTDPDFAAGSASAGTWPNLASGTLLSSPEAGAIERDTSGFYMTPNASSGRGILTAEYWIIQQATRNLTSTTSEQKLFDSVTNGTLTLPTGLYAFDCQFGINNLSATSGNLAFDVLGGGTAVLGTATMYHAVGVDNNSPTAVAARNGQLVNAGQSSASIIAAGTGTGIGVAITGVFEISTAGTIIPSVTLVTAAAGTVFAGSHFRCHQIGPDAGVSVGAWT